MFFQSDEACIKFIVDWMEMDKKSLKDAKESIKVYRRFIKEKRKHMAEFRCHLTGQGIVDCIARSGIEGCQRFIKSYTALINNEKKRIEYYLKKIADNQQRIADMRATRLKHSKAFPRVIQGKPRGAHYPDGGGRKKAHMLKVINAPEVSARGSVVSEIYKTWERNQTDEKRYPS